jgi:hypothetical protein
MKNPVRLLRSARNDKGVGLGLIRPHKPASVLRYEATPNDPEMAEATGLGKGRVEELALPSHRGRRPSAMRQTLGSQPQDFPRDDAEQDQP